MPKLDFKLHVYSGNLEFIFSDYTTGTILFRRDGDNSTGTGQNATMSSDLSSGHTYIFDVPSIDGGTDVDVSMIVDGVERFYGRSGTGDATKVADWQIKRLNGAKIQGSGWFGGDREVVMDV